MHERIKIRTSRELQLVWRGKRQRNKRESSLFGKSVGNERNQTSSGQTTRNLNRNEQRSITWTCLFLPTVYTRFEHIEDATLYLDAAST
nr:hypothetical protein CFP56_68902 [Quercus suber]